MAVNQPSDVADHLDFLSLVEPQILRSVRSLILPVSENGSQNENSQKSDFFSQNEDVTVWPLLNLSI